MSSSDAKRRRPSLRITLFFRLVIGFALFGIVLNTFLWLALLPSLAGAPGEDSPLELSNRVIIAQKILDELGADPTVERARRAGGGVLKLRFRGPAGSWETDPDLPPWEALERGAATFPTHPAFRVGPGAVLGRSGDRELAVIFPPGFLSHAMTSPGVQLLFLGEIGTMVLLCLAFALWQFRPLRALTAAAHRLAEGELGVTVPVTQRSELGDLARAFNEMSERLKRLLDSRDDFLADVSHELRSPLARIRLAMELKDESKGEVVNRNLQEMGSLIDRLLERHRLHRDPAALTRTTFDYGALLGEIAAAYPHFRQRLAVPGISVTLTADRERIHRVLTNLVDNALKYSPGRVEILVEELGDRIRTRVRDEGPGVPASALPHLFEPFFRVDRSRSKSTGGFGLGLDLCLRTVVAHGGQIHAENLPPKGLQITFDLPKGVNRL